MGWLIEGTTYHSQKGNFCSKADARTVTKNGERFKIVVQHRRIGGKKSKALENAARGRQRAAEASDRSGERWLQVERKGSRISQPQKCKYCENPASKALLWAEARAYVPVCGDEHLAKARKQVGEHGDGVRPIPSA